MCIKLEEPYITEKKQIKKDRFVTDLFETLNINLMKIKINEEFNINDLEIELRKTLKEPTYE